MSGSDPAGSRGGGEEPPDGRRLRRQELEQQLKLCPTARDAYLELAVIYRQDQLPQHALRVLKQAADLFPEDEALLWDYEEAQLARSLQKLGEVRELASKLNNPAADEELERSVVDWANVRIKVCRHRLRRDPSRAMLRLVLGEALCDLENYKDAIDELEPLADSESHGAAANWLLGRCHLSLSRDTEAMRCFRAAALRRSVVGPAKVRVAALRQLIDLADRHGLTATMQYYQQSLEKCLRDEATPSGAP